MITLKVKFLGESGPMTLTHGRIYEVKAVEGDWYRIVDDTGEDYLYHKGDFEEISG